jgi:hypothetical protein
LGVSKTQWRNEVLVLKENEYELARISGSPSQIEEKKLTREVALDN